MYAARSNNCVHYLALAVIKKKDKAISTNIIQTNESQRFELGCIAS